MKEEKYIQPKKSELRQLGINDISQELPNLKDIKESKAIVIGKWIMSWIDENNISPNTLMPSKPELAYLLGVSIGTIQNALRFVEDAGYVESKQCIGTMIKDRKNTSNIRKLTSKREITIEKIKKYIKKNNLKTGTYLPSSRSIAKEIESSPNTTRLALENLCVEGILEHRFKNSNDCGWVVKKTDFSTEKNIDEQKTLVKKVETDLMDFITENLKIGSKLPPHEELAKKLNVSIKTIHDALKSLADEGIILPRRGRYGTSVIKMPYDKSLNIGIETSIFAKAKETAFYYYERTQNHIKRLISENYQIGDRLPSIMELSRQMDLSPNTIRKAFQNLAKEGYLVFTRGRYGGTFVIDIPPRGEETFKWLAVNPQYAKLYSN